MLFGMPKAAKLKLMDIKETVTVRLKRDVKRRIKQAAARTRPQLNMSEYVEKAVEAQLAKDAAPGSLDFKRRFARPPKGPRVGDRLVELILSEREDS
jgi:predicted nucleic acid-binding protein